ncbi:MAG: FtsX-like permease family protein, partial [Chloroflexota bacterium]|nr:FtsX-like permease family protein [Chloroflexota bacterium]
AVAGLGLAQLLFGAELRVAAPSVVAIGLVVLAGLGATALATLTATWPLRDLFRGEVAARRIELQRSRSPLWQRLYLDVLALVGAGIVYWLVAGAGVHPVLTAEGNPTVSLALTSFLAPLLLWLGGSLLLLRLIRAAVGRSDLTARLLRRPLGPGGVLAARSLAARSGSATRAIVLLALAVSFATSILVFDATYLQQQRVDAALTLGADLKAVPTQAADRTATTAVEGGGVTAASPVAGRVVYVGSEAQDLLAVDPHSLPSVAQLSDGFFRGITAAQAMDTLASQPDAILVSDETARDYSIVPGDRIRIRIADASGKLREVDFRMAGVVLEFPTAPRDAFLVANLDYLASQSGDGRISFVLARTTDPGAAAAVRSRLGGGWTVSDLSSTNARLANSVTSVDLGALVALDVAFAVGIASIGVSLALLAGLAERRRELATLEAIGAEPRQLLASIAGEATIVGVGGTLAGLATGALVGASLLAVLAGIFDPPADVPALPLGSLIGLVVAVVVALSAAVLVAQRAVGRIPVLSALRER